MSQTIAMEGSYLVWEKAPGERMLLSVSKQCLAVCSDGTVLVVKQKNDGPLALNFAHIGRNVTGAINITQNGLGGIMFSRLSWVMAAPEWREMV